MNQNGEKKQREESQKPSDSSIDSQELMARRAPSPVQPSNDSSSQALHLTRTTYSKQLTPGGGNLQKLSEKAKEALIATAEEESSTLTQIGTQAIRDFIDRNSRGFIGAIPMICQGAGCPFISACPLKEANSVLPEGKRCPVESSLVQLWVNKHLSVLGIEDVFAPENSFDLDMLYELAGQELLRWRCGVHISDTPALVSREIVGSNQVGEPIFQDVINPVLEIMDRAGKNVAKLREALLATRKAQIQAGKDMSDANTTMARLQQEAKEKVKQRLAAQREKVQDAEFEVKDE